MKAGLYVVNFSSSFGNFGGGVVTIESGRIQGGDSGYLYLGTYQTKDTALSAQVTVKRHNPNAQSIFGNLNEFDLSLHGSFTDNSFTANGSVSGRPMAKININAKKVADPIPTR